MTEIRIQEKDMSMYEEIQKVELEYAKAQWLRENPGKTYCVDYSLATREYIIRQWPAVQ